jgi:hypothetical protein
MRHDGPDFSTELARLTYVLKALEPYKITESDVSRAVGWKRSEVNSLLDDLEQGQNVALRRWRALFELFAPMSEKWWFRGTGHAEWKPEDCYERIRVLSDKEKERLQLEAIRKSESAGEPSSRRNVVHLRKTGRKLKK